MAEEKKTIGYTESRDFRCLEDLQEAGSMGTGYLIRLDYCGTERCKPGYAFGPYIRENYVIHVILEGKGQLRIEGKTYDVEENQAFLLKPGLEATYQADLEHPWVYAWIGFHGLQSEKIVMNMGFTEGCFVVPVRDAAVLGNYIECMLDHSRLNFADYLKRISYLGLFVSDMIEDVELPRQQDHFSEDTYVNMAVDAMISNYEKPLKIAGIASQIGINRSYLSIIFKKKMGVSPQQFLVDFRLEKAAECLRETDMPVRTIAMGVGYADPLTFSKAFKKKYGVNPTSYRENPPRIFETDAKGNYTGTYNL